MCRRSVLALLCVLVASCGGDAAGPVIVGAPSASPDPIQSRSSIVAWGDSLTAGATASSPDMSYPAQLARLTGRNVVNEGVGGQTSREIAARQGGAPALLTLLADLMPPAGAARVQDASVSPITSGGPGPITGSLVGVHGVLTRADPFLLGPELVFRRDDPGNATQVPAQSPFVPDTFDRERWLNLFWLGRNNFADPDQVLSDLHACVASLQTDHYVVLSILNVQGEGRHTSPYQQIADLNARIAGEFAGHYLDVRQVLLDHYDASDPQDRMDYADDVPPSSLRGDESHPNDAGYRIVANAVAEFINVRGW